MHYTMIVNQVDISRCLQRILNINHLRTVRSLREVVSCHISFSRNTGAPAFALDHFALPLFLDYTVLEGSHPKRYKKAAPSFTPSHPLPVAVSHTSAAKALSHQTLPKRQHAHHEHAAHGRGRSGAHGPADTAKSVSHGFCQSCSHQSQKIAIITCPFRARIAFSRCVVSAKYNQTCWKLLVLTCNDIPTESPPLRQSG